MIRFLLVTGAVSAAVSFFAPFDIAHAEIVRFEVQSDTPVYPQPDRKLKPVYNLNFGDQIKLSSKRKNGFQLIQYKLNGRVQRGYVLSSDVEGYKIENDTAQTGSSYFFSVVKSYHTQGKRTLQTNTDDIYDLGEFSGDSLFFALGRDFSINDSFAVRAGLVLRNMSLEGDVTQEGSPTVSTFDQEQKFYGLQLGLKYSFSSLKNWALLGEFEFDRSYSQDLIVKKGPAVDDSGLKDINHVAISGSILYNWAFARRWAMEPSIRYGMVVSAPAFITLIEGLITLHYR